MLHKSNIRQFQPQPDHSGSTGVSSVPQSLSQLKRGNCHFYAFLHLNPCPLAREKKVVGNVSYASYSGYAAKQICKLCAQSSRESVGHQKGRTHTGLLNRTLGVLGRAPTLSTLIGHVGSYKKNVICPEICFITCVFTLSNLRYMYLEHYNTLLNFQSMVFFKAYILCNIERYK